MLSSSSHALIGSIAGAAIASKAHLECYITKVSAKIIIVLIVSPIIAFCVGLTIFNF
ncbi:inorganic phosphate transporter [Staphylococcus aureus]